LGGLIPGKVESPPVAGELLGKVTTGIFGEGGTIIGEPETPEGVAIFGKVIGVDNPEEEILGIDELVPDDGIISGLILFQTDDFF